MSFIDRPSPNFGPRRGGASPSLIVLHYTGMDCTEAALHRLCTEEFEVSAHYLVDEAGRVFRLVDERMRAWHAGNGEWGGRPDVNSRSLGIEIANPGDRPYAGAAPAVGHAPLAHSTAGGFRAFGHGTGAQVRSGPAF